MCITDADGRRIRNLRQKFGSARMERWLEKVRPGLGKYHTHLAGFGVEHVEDLAMLDDDMLE